MSTLENMAFSRSLMASGDMSSGTADDHSTTTMVLTLIGGEEEPQGAHNEGQVLTLTAHGTVHHGKHQHAVVDGVGWCVRVEVVHAGCTVIGAHANLRPYSMRP